VLSSTRFRTGICGGFGRRRNNKKKGDHLRIYQQSFPLLALPDASHAGHAEPLEEGAIPENEDDEVYIPRQIANVDEDGLDEAQEEEQVQQLLDAFADVDFLEHGDDGDDQGSVSDIGSERSDDQPFRVPETDWNDKGDLEDRAGEDAWEGGNAEGVAGSGNAEGVAGSGSVQADFGDHGLAEPARLVAVPPAPPDAAVPLELPPPNDFGPRRDRRAPFPKLLHSEHDIGGRCRR